MKIKAFLLLALTLCISAALCGCGKGARETELSPAAQSPVEYRDEAGELIATCTLTSLSLEPGGEGSQDRVTASLLFENKSDVALMRISSGCDFTDASGAVLQEANCNCDYHKNPMQPGEKREYNVSRWIYDGEKVAGVALNITGVVTIEQEPMLPEPKTGVSLFDFFRLDDISAFAANFYTDTPAKANVFMDSWNKTDADLTDSEAVAAVFEAMSSIRVDAVTGEYYTDSYNRITFCMEDGTEYGFSFNRYNLEYDGVCYELSGDDGLWELLHELLDA